MAIEGIPQSSRTRIYKRIVAQLKTDPDIGSRVEWICWDGSRKDVTTIASNKPTIRLFPQLGPGQFAYADGQRNDLIIDVEMFIQNSYDATDCLDLWTAIEQAIYPFNQREKQKKFELALEALGAEIGEILFAQPGNAEPASTNEGRAGFYCRGSMTISVRRTFNP